MKIQRRSGAKIQMKCHRCRSNCQPKDGDWHDGDENQVFLCRACEIVLKPLRAKLPCLTMSAFVAAF